MIDWKHIMEVRDEDSDASAVLVEGINFKYHVFGSGETIHAIIKKLNHQNMTDAILRMLVKRYNQMNDGMIPKLGQRVKIPLFVGFIGMPQHNRSYEND